MSVFGWQLEGMIARLAATWSGSIDLARPADGVSLSQNPTANVGAAWRILGVSIENDRPIDATRIDAYVRGQDLVATYDEAPPKRVRAQIYWRLLKGSELSPALAEHVPTALDLIVSVNTSLLDSDPQSSVRSVIPTAEQVLGISADGASSVSMQKISDGAAAAGNTHGFVVRPANAEFSYLEIVHPADFCRSEVRNAPDMPAVELVHHLFQQRLEKGVILRARVRTAVVVRGHDEAVALAAYQQFAATEPPLTV